MRFVSSALLCAAFLNGMLTCPAHALSYKPGREYRTINTDQYEISVQKNGRTDINFISHAPVFSDACPSIWMEGEEARRPLKIDGRWTSRSASINGLGEGPMLVFEKDDCRWILQAYPTQPFFTAQVSYVNNTKKPVRVKMLSPWTIGITKNSALHFGPNAAAVSILDTGSMTRLDPRLWNLSKGSCTSVWHTALFNPENGQSLIAGFLTHLHGYTQVHVSRTEKAAPNIIDAFRAECLYEPAIEVKPGEMLESEVAYIGITESNPLEGLERFAVSMAKLNNHKPTRFALPHGWDSWSAKYRFDVNEQNMLEALDFVDNNLKRYGWTHFSIDAGWETAKGQWEPDPARWPHGMKWFAEQIHARGMTAGLWTDPFTVKLGTPLANEHPEWMLEPSPLGRGMIGDDERILDISAPGAYEYVRDLYRKIGSEWGYDALVEVDFVYHLLFATNYAQAELTHAELLALGMKAVREGFGSDKFIMSTPPHMLNTLFVDGMRIGTDCAPVWRKQPDKWPWGCVETLTSAARRYHLGSHLWAIDQDCAFFGLPATRERWGVTDAPELTWEQSVAWLTGAALTGGAVKIGDAYPDLSARHVDVLRRLLPTASRAARPVDLFERDQPRIWALPVTSPIGNWTIVGVFNWDENNADKVKLDFARLGLNPNAFYAVYDFWSDTYYGNARGELDVSMAPGCVRLLGLKPYEDRPMFLATDRHFTMGATDFTGLAWNAQDRTLSGAFKGVADTEYQLRVLVPDGYTVGNVQASAGPVATERDGKVLKLRFHCVNEGPVTWSASF